MTPIWANKYRPTNLSDYIFQNNTQKQKFEEYIRDKSIPNLLLSGNPGTGKAQPLDAKILTPTGWITMGEIQVGDVVLTPSGNKAKVIQVHPQGRKEVYRLHMHDGSSTEACLEHLWKCSYINGRSNRKASDHIESTQFVIDYISKQSQNKNIRQISIPVIEQGIEFDIKEQLTIPPYLLGVLLGDGCISGKEGKSSISITSMDNEIVDRCLTLLDKDYHLTVSNKAQLKAPSYRIVSKIRNGKPNRYQTYLKDMGLMGTHSHTKFIPENYKTSSVKSRFEIIQGLMDTDGTVDKKGCVSFSTSSLMLAKDLQEILWSIGAVCSLNIKRPFYKIGDIKKEGMLSYTLNIAFNGANQLFGLSRKRDRCNDVYARRKHIDNLTLKRRIKSVEKSRITEAKCITLDSEDQLYITNDYIVTHNSTIARLFVNELINSDNRYSDEKVINASKDNNAETVRTTISNFVESYPMGDFKIILLEEADYLSHSAQGMLRPLTEDFTDSVRFIITCNYPNKILPALKSRFTQYHFDDMPVDDMMARLIEIVMEENVEPDLEVLEECINASYPDMREVINNVQNCVVDGKLVSKKIIQTKEWKNNLLSSIVHSNWDKMYNCVNVDIPSNEFEDFYTMMYENIDKFKSFEIGTLKFDMAMVLIADHLFRHASFGQPHINAGALVLNLKHLEK